MGIVQDLRPIAKLTVVADLGTVNESGVWTTGTTSNLTFCHIELGNKRVMNTEGTEVISRGSVFSLEDYSLFAGVDGSRQAYRFTLPSTWPEPRTSLLPIDILREEDDEGEVYEEIIL